MENSNAFNLPMNGKEFIEHQKWDDQEHAALGKRLSKLEYLIDDDPATNHKGMASKVDELYKVFVEGNGIIKFLVKLIAVLGVGYEFLSSILNHVKIK
jgi:hypothetical protein